MAFSLTTSLPLSISYGIQADTLDNKFIRLFEKVLKGVNRCAVPGSFLVDIIRPREYYGCVNITAIIYMNPRLDTIVKYLPQWFPGAQFHTFAQKVNEDSHDARYISLDHVADTLKVGSLRMMISTYWLTSSYSQVGTSMRR